MYHRIEQCLFLRNGGEQTTKLTTDSSQVKLHQLTVCVPHFFISIFRIKIVALFFGNFFGTSLGKSHRVVFFRQMLKLYQPSSCIKIAEVTNSYFVIFYINLTGILKIHQLIVVTSDIYYCSCNIERNKFKGASNQSYFITFQQKIE